MELTGKVPATSNKEELWKALFNPEIWKEVLPDAERYEEIGENLYEMAIKADIGPIKGTQMVKIHFTNLNPPNSFNFDIQNQLIKSASGQMELEENEAPASSETYPEGTRTILNYSLNADAGNPIFNAVLESLKGKIKEGFEEIVVRVAEKAAEQS